MSRTLADVALADAIARGLPQPPPSQLDLALNMPRLFTPGDWTLTGPTRHGGYVISDKRGRTIATVPAADVGPAQAAANARAMLRAAHMTAVLEHVEGALSSDDDGTRWGDLLALIRDELKRQPM